MNIDEQVELLMQGTEYGDEALKKAMTAELRERLLLAQKENRPLRVYCGYDPTSTDLHLGHTITMRKLRQFQDLGHEVTFLIGSYTALVGDPSDKNKARPILTEAQVAENAVTYTEQAYRVLDRNKTKIRYNGEWLSKLTLVDLIRLGQLDRLGRGHRRTAADRRRQHGQLLATARAQLLQFGEIVLGARYGAQFDHRFALNRERIAVTRLQRQRLVGEADRFAEQFFLLGDARQNDERGAVARIDRKRGFKRVVGGFELARGEQSFALADHVLRFRHDLVVGLLTRDRGRENRSSGAYQQQAVQQLHQRLQFAPGLPSMAGPTARRKSHRYHPDLGPGAARSHSNARR